MLVGTKLQGARHQRPLCRNMAMPCSTRQALLCTPTHCTTSAIHSTERTVARQHVPCGSSATLHAACQPRPSTVHHRKPHRIPVFSTPALVANRESMRIPHALQTDISSAAPDEDDECVALLHLYANPTTLPRPSNRLLMWSVAVVLVACATCFAIWHSGAAPTVKVHRMCALN